MKAQMKIYSVLCILLFTILFDNTAYIHCSETPALVPDHVSIKVQRKGNDHSVTATGIINADIDSVWTALVDYDNHEKYMPNVIQSKILSRSGISMMVFKQIKVSFKQTDMVLKVTADEGKHICTWIQHKGNFKKNQGSWILKAGGNNTTHITYSAIVEPAFYMPGWLKKHLQEKSVPDVIRSVARRAILLKGNK